MRLVGAMPPGCRVCGRDWSPWPDTVLHQGRGLCQRCYARARLRGTLDRWPRLTMGGDTSAVLEDVAWLHASGVAPVEWPDRVGKTPQALAKLLYRHGRHDLAREVQRAH